MIPHSLPAPMESLPDSLLVQILSQLDDSADVARSRVASKSFNSVSPDLRSINLRCPLEWLDSSSTSSVSTSQRIKTIFLDIISKLRIVESVFVVLEHPLVRADLHTDDFNPTDPDFAREWLPRVSKFLKSLSLSGRPDHRRRKSNLLPLISEYCHNLVSLQLKWAWLSVDNLKPMPMLTTLTLSFITLEDENLNELNKCFPNLQYLKLLEVGGLKDPKIRFLNLKTCICDVFDNPPSLMLICPNLISLEVNFFMPAALHVEAPMLSHLYLGLRHAGAFMFKKFENLKTLWLDSLCFGSVLSEFPVTKTVENLTLDSGDDAARDSELTLGKVFTVLPNVTSLCIKSGAWLELEACLNPQGWEMLDGGKGLKTICVYLKLVDPSLTFSCIARVLDQCVGLSEVSLLTHVDVDETFMSRCMTRWPGFKWRWGVWGEEIKDFWIYEDISD